MQFVSRNNENILIRVLQPSDYKAVSDYLYGLSHESQNRFGPHSYDVSSIEEFYSTNSRKLDGYITIQTATGKVIGYSLLKYGLLDYERSRLEEYGLRLNAFADATYAPSVADEWQQFGIGFENFKMIAAVCKDKKIDRLFLWGGVQAGNERAVNFYKRNGFVELGRFQYKGDNIDMMLLVK